MHAIWKFPLSLKKEQVLSLPLGAVSLSAQSMRGGLCLWVWVDPQREPKDRRVRILGTGEQVDDLVDEWLVPGGEPSGSSVSTVWNYVSTVVDGAYVWHVFVEKE